MSDELITTGPNFVFIQDSFIEAKQDLMHEIKTGIVNNERLKGIGLSGASRCLNGNSLVSTIEGLKHIKEIKEGDYVKSYNQLTDCIEYRKCIKPHKFTENKKKIIRITLKNGKTIEATEDHKFFFKGAWVELKHLVSLLDGKMDKNKRL